MKNCSFTFKLFLVSVFILSIVACKRDSKICDTTQELTDKQHLVDLTPLDKVPQFLEELTKYPQLRVNSIVDDEYMTQMNCDVFHGNLLFFFANYDLSKSKKDGYVFKSGEILVPQNLDINPVFTSAEAISKAKSELEFKSCLNYRLGILPVYDENNNTTNFKLAWKISDEYKSQFVIVDAKSGDVLMKDDGVRFAQ